MSLPKKITQNVAKTTFIFFSCGPPEVPRCHRSYGIVRPLDRPLTNNLPIVVKIYTSLVPWKTVSQSLRYILKNLKIRSKVNNHSPVAKIHPIWSSWNQPLVIETQDPGVQYAKPRTPGSCRPLATCTYVLVNVTASITDGLDSKASKK
jgi:hypothetical protein